MKIDSEDPSYVFGLHLDREGGCAEIQDTLQSAAWIHIDYGEPTAQSFIGSLGLPDRIAQAMVQPDTRPRTVISGTGTLVFIRGVNLNPGAEPEDMVSLRIWIEPERLITVRQRKLLSVQDLKMELEQGQGPSSIPDLVVSLINRIADRISDYVDKMEGQLEVTEIATQNSRDATVRSEISALRREIASVRRYLAPQRDALDSLYTHSLTSMPEGYAFRLREQMDRMTRYIEDLDLFRERTLVLQEEWTNISMEEQNARMYALSIIAAVFLPITFVTGVFGMNVAGLPGIDDPYAFLYVIGSMFIVSAVVVTFLKIKRWL